MRILDNPGSKGDLICCLVWLVGLQPTVNGWSIVDQHKLNEFGDEYIGVPTSNASTQFHLELLQHVDSQSGFQLLMFWPKPVKVLGSAIANVLKCQVVFGQKMQAQMQGTKHSEFQLTSSDVTKYA